MDGYLLIDQNLFRCANCYRFSESMRFHKCAAFCTECLLEETEEPMKCPICNKIILSNENNAFLVKNIIPDIMDCPNRSWGCSWKGSMYEYGSHTSFCHYNALNVQYVQIKAEDLTISMSGYYIVRYGKLCVYLGDIKNGKRHGKGKETKNGIIYDGEWVDDMKEGFGNFKYADGSTFSGYIYSDKRNGKGLFCNYNGDMYDGEWKDDKYDGCGIFSTNKGYVYKGQWNNGKRHGKGSVIQVGYVINAFWQNDVISDSCIIYYNNGDLYEGNVDKNMLKNGIGRMTYSNGTFYEGMWKDDYKHGRGKTNRRYGNLVEAEFSQNDILTIYKIEFDKFERFEGNYSELNGKGQGTFYYAYGKYEGEFGHNFRKEGNGLFIYNNKDVYKGKYVHDKKEGYGEMNFKNGDSYQGEWKTDLYHGKGKFYRAADKSTYEGFFELGAKQGSGKMINKNGDCYDGFWYKDKFSGKGTLVKGQLKYQGDFSAGAFNGFGSLSLNGRTVYTGNFLNGEFEGQGSYYYDNGDKYYGIFNEGKITDKGKYYFKNGDVYTGGFKNDAFDGQGKYKYAKGNIYNGEFKQGMFFGKGAFYDFQKKTKYEANWKADVVINMGIKMSKFDPKSNIL